MAIVTTIFKKQQNLFCIHIKKNKSLLSLKPWIKINSNKHRFNTDWVKKNVID